MKLIVGFSRASKWWKVGSRAIQSVNKRDYSHCFILYTCPVTGEGVVAQASHGYVNLVNLEIFKKDNVIVKEYELQVPDSEALEIFKFIFKSLGKSYSGLQLLLILVKEVFRFEIKSYNRDKYYICSEYAARICSLLNVAVPTELDYLRPTDLDSILTKAGVPRA